SIYLTRGGTVSAPLKFVEAAIGDDPILTSLHLHGVSYVEVRGLTIVGPKVLPAKWVDMPTVVIDSPATPVRQDVAWANGRQAAVDARYATFVA
ncbi:hypothetical protein ACI4BE_27915, partial [Klebsiella pneumoniae]|uniref:hypothetical protein n=1 Tax=Klebsiella pneumoniae TaxID=573 RepID=UPI0038535947